MAGIFIVLTKQNENKINEFKILPLLEFKRNKFRFEGCFCRLNTMDVKIIYKFKFIRHQNSFFFPVYPSSESLSIIITITAFKFMSMFRLC